jgi:hypothetical protein
MKEIVMTKHSMRKIPAAAAMAAALLFGVQAQAQTDNNNTPPGSTNPKDAAVMPAPSDTAPPVRAGTDAGAAGSSSSGMPGSSGADSSSAAGTNQGAAATTDQANTDDNADANTTKRNARRQESLIDTSPAAKVHSR